MANAYAERVEFWQGGKIVGAHPRAFGRGKTVYDPLHYIPVLARKPGALRSEPRGRHRVKRHSIVTPYWCAPLLLDRLSELN